MKASIWIACSLFVVLSSNNNAKAYFLSGNDLYKECQTSSEFCRGSISAYDDMAETLESNVYCMRKTTQLRQLKDILVSYMQRNPQERDRAAVNIFLEAMREAYPC